MNSRKLGVHLSIQGGIHRALISAKELNINALQIFLKNTNRWEGKELSETDTSLFWKERLRFRELTIIAHSGYLINLAGDSVIRNKSIASMTNEINRAAFLSIPFLVIHPGSHKDSSFNNGIKRIISSLDSILSSVRNETMILLETTAGQGSSLGYKFDHFAQIIDSSKYSERLGICIDTCHTFAAGYNFTTEDGYRGMMREIRSTVGIEKIKCIHLNDSKRDLGSRVDRHEHIGKGKIGIRGFAFLLADSNLNDIPIILETPKEYDPQIPHDILHADRINLKTVKRIMRLKPSIPDY